MLPSRYMYEEVFATLKGMGTTKAVGFDGFPVAFFKNYGASLGEGEKEAFQLLKDRLRCKIDCWSTRIPHEDYLVWKGEASELDGLEKVLPANLLGNESWKAPKSPFARINFDAAYNKKDNRSCSGLVVRDSNVMVLVARTTLNDNVPFVLQRRLLPVFRDSNWESIWELWLRR
ncbi:hypothetical protein PVK06_011733 [Gossypium arboreum]|uniref:Uncharacterized protein n=1 Tax=Gossypium arboreum TaxID=29729 RepID=A0ABR0QAH5_GOSAR|nr:hypothetical protein PVK06_011733 [Gossypium arboreum]